MFHSRVSSFKLATMGAIAATALAGAPAAIAATSGGAAAAPASANVAKSAPFTIGLSATTVKPGAKLTISGLAYARAGLNLTIMSNAIMSSRTVSGVPAVQTPALVEGIYQATVRVPPATEPGVYWVYLRFNNKQVAAIRTLRVVAANSPTAGRRSSTGAPASASPSCTTTARVRRTCRPAGTRSPARTWTVVRPRRTSRASWLAPAGRSPVGTRPRPRQAVRPSPSAAAGSPSASRRRADPLPSAPLALGRTATAARPSAVLHSSAAFAVTRQ